MYNTIQDLINRLGEKSVIELSNPFAYSESVNEQVINAALTDGQGLVDSYLGQRVTLPLASVPPFVKTLALDIAVYYLNRNVGKADKECVVIKLYDDAIAHLKSFAKGETSLGLVVDEGKENHDHAEITSSPRRCTRQILGNLT